VRVGQLREVIDDLIPRYQPTAVVCYSDTIALTVSRALLTAGFTLPGDISVTGYNDLPLVDNIYPPLTTVRSDFYQLGKMAGEMLMELLQSPKTELNSRFICPQLIVRNTTGPVPRSSPAKKNRPLNRN
jgi:LacI family transcriptional regulator